MPNAPRRPTSGGRRPDWTLPNIVDIQIRRVPFKAREYKHFRSALADYKEAIEFLVQFDGPIPIRALGPALFVGNVQVMEAEAVKDNLYRFLAFDIERLRSGAPITLGWNSGNAADRKATDFRFSLE